MVAGSPGSARRRLRRKTSEVDEVQLNGRGGSAPGAIGSGSGAEVDASAGVVDLRAVGSPGSARRRLARKTSAAELPLGGSAGGVVAPSGGRAQDTAGGTPAGAMVSSVAGSPGSARRRLTRKTSDAEGSQLGGRGGSAPGAHGSGAGAEVEASVGAGDPRVAGSPGSARRRLVRKTSEAELPLGGSAGGGVVPSGVCAPDAASGAPACAGAPWVAVSPGSARRRLARKTSEADCPQSGVPGAAAPSLGSVVGAADSAAAGDLESTGVGAPGVARRCHGGRGRGARAVCDAARESGQPLRRSARIAAALEERRVAAALEERRAGRGGGGGASRRGRRTG